MASKKGIRLGRPKAYRTEAELRKGIEKYLNSCCRTVPVLIGGEPVRNDLGEPMTEVQYIQPLTVAGLCLSLGITTRTWENYCDQSKHPEFAEATEMTRTLLVAYSTTAMLSDPKNARAHQFNLSANYGVGGKDRTDSAGTQSIESYLAACGERAEF